MTVMLLHATEQESSDVSSFGNEIRYELGYSFWNGGQWCIFGL